MSIRDINPNDDYRENEGNDENLPGYPHYPASEDITHPSNGAKKVSVDPDEISRGQRVPDNADRGVNKDIPTSSNEEDELLIVPGTEADVTKEDLELLGPRDEDMDMSDDELLRGKDKLDNIDQDASEKTMADDEDLDIPGSELDDEDEAIGEEDEENNYYSLGGDRHENLDEDNQQEPE